MPLMHPLNVVNLKTFYSVYSAGFGKPVWSFPIFKIMHRPSSRHPKANKETISTTKIRQHNNVRVTRSRAKALGVSMSPSKPAFKQESKRVPRANNKQMASDDVKVCNLTATSYKHILKDVTNTTLAETICTDCLDGGNAKVCGFLSHLFSSRIPSY